MDLPDFRIFPDDANATPGSVNRRRKIAEVMLQQGQDYSPIASPWQGAARVANALMGGWNIGRANATENEQKAKASSALQAALQSKDVGSIAAALNNDWNSEGAKTGASLLVSNMTHQQDAARAQANADRDYALGVERLKLAQEGQWTRLGNNLLVNSRTGQTQPIPGGMPADFKDVTELRKEVQQLPSYKNLAQAAPIYNAMSSTAGTNSRASDLNLVYGLGKIMDPGSVVREGEMVMVKNTGSLPDWLLGTINSLNGGAALTPQTRAAILKEAYGRINGYKSQFDNDAKQYRGIIQRRQMNEADVLPDFGNFQPWTPPAQPQGGGDPVETEMRRRGLL